MKGLRYFALAVGILGVAAAVYADDSGRGRNGNRNDGRQSVLEFDTMTPVVRPFTGNTNAIRGVAGGGLPWVLGSAKGELDTDGHIEVKVTGLVIDPNDPAAIRAGVAGTNPVPQFRAIVSCLSTGGASVNVANVANVANVMTAPFPATMGPASAGGGNANIEAWLQLPKPCIAPIVFVTSPNGTWFAATGF